MTGGLDFRNELMGIPGGSWIVEQFDKWAARISGTWLVQHYDDGSHKDITADSVTTDNLTTVQEQLSATILRASSRVRIGSNNPSQPGISINQSASEVTFTENDGTTKTTIHAFKGEFLPSAGSGGTVTTNTVVADAMSELTTDAGVTVDSVLLKDGAVYEHSRTTALGEWIDVPFDAGDFTGSGSMTWTVAEADLDTFKYMLVGNTMFVDVSIDTSSVGGTLSNGLRVAIPGGFTAATKKTAPAAIVFDNSSTVSSVMPARVLASDTAIEIHTLSGTFSASTDLTYVRLSFYFEVQ